MMLAAPTLRTVPVTLHMPLIEAARELTTDLIVKRCQTTARGLQRDFGIDSPRLAVAGFNPHAGEGGALGREEIDIIQPAIDLLRAEGLTSPGLSRPAVCSMPAPARSTSAAICMYHDQALIPLKALYFDGGEHDARPADRPHRPDHGTAFGIAGTGQARPERMIAAIRLAAECATRRLGG